MPLRLRPQILIPAILLALGASLIAASMLFAPFGLIGEFLEFSERALAFPSASLIAALERPLWAPYVEAAAALALGSGALYALSVHKRRTATGIGVLGVIALLGASWFFYATEGILIDPAASTVALIVVFVTYWAARRISVGVRRRRVRSAFGTQISRRRAELLAAVGGQRFAPAERKTVTALSCRILNAPAVYAALAAQPVRLVGLTKEFLRLSSDVVLDQEGTMSGQSGDRFIAFWNAPLEDPEHARHGCLSALKIVETIRQLNEKLVDAGATAKGLSIPPLHIGIGIETGESFLGPMRRGRPIDYAALGGAVSQARKLQRQAGNYGVSIIVGQQTRRFVSDLPLLELDRVASKGQETATKIYTLLEECVVGSETAFQAHQLIHSAMLHAYRHQHWDEATNYLQKCMTFSDELQRLYAIYHSRIEHYGSTTPKTEWDGSIVSAQG